MRVWNLPELREGQEVEGHVRRTVRLGRLRDVVEQRDITHEGQPQAFGTRVAEVSAVRVPHQTHVVRGAICSYVLVGEPTEVCELIEWV